MVTTSKQRAGEHHQVGHRQIEDCDIEDRARAVAEAVTDPELPMVTLAELGILRSVAVRETGEVKVDITPTYSGCPALTEIRADLRRRLRQAGYPQVEVRTVWSPPWTSEWISAEGRRKLAEHGIDPPGRVPERGHGPVPLTLEPTRRAVHCPHCGSSQTEELSWFGATACRALWRCRCCLDPFEHFKEV